MAHVFTVSICLRSLISKVGLVYRNLRTVIHKTITRNVTRTRDQTLEYQSVYALRHFTINSEQMPAERN